MDIANIFLFIIGTIASAMPAPLVKHYLKTDNSLWLMLSAISYLILVFVYTLLFKVKGANLTAVLSGSDL